MVGSAEENFIGIGSMQSMGHGFVEGHCLRFFGEFHKIHVPTIENGHVCDSWVVVIRGCRFNKF
jgi:hypothetical protein